MSFALEIKKKTMNINIYGTEHKVRFPTCAEAEDFEQRINEAKGTKEVMEVMRSYLEMLGLPASVTKEMDTVDFTDVIAFVNNPKKK